MHSMHVNTCHSMSPFSAICSICQLSRDHRGVYTRSAASCLALTQRPAGQPTCCMFTHAKCSKHR